MSPFSPVFYTEAAVILTLNVRFFSWELQVNLRVQFNAKQSSKPKRDTLSATYMANVWAV